VYENRVTRYVGLGGGSKRKQKDAQASRVLVLAKYF
jgi:hypothetical protein